MTNGEIEKKSEKENVWLDGAKKQRGEKILKFMPTKTSNEDIVDPDYDEWRQQNLVRIDANATVMRCIDSCNKERGNSGEVKPERYEILTSLIEKADKIDNLTAERMIYLGSDGTRIILNNLEKFPNIDRDSFGEKLIHLQQGELLVEKLEQFPHLNMDHLANSLLGQHSTVYGPQILADNLDVFPRLNRNLLAETLAEGGRFDIIVEHFDEFPNLDFEQIFNHSSNQSVADLMEKMQIHITDPRVEKMPLSKPEQYQIQQSIEQVTDENGGIDYQKVLELLCTKWDNWRDEEHTNGPMRRGAEIFGYQRMFEYLDDKPTLHSELFFFDDVIKMYQNYQTLVGEKASPEQFFHNILAQVKMDNSAYEYDGEDWLDAQTFNTSPYAKLAEIAQNTDFSPESLARYREKVQHLREQGFAEETSKISELLAGKCFDSWKNLKNTSELIEMFERSDVWERLTSLKFASAESPREAALYDYIETLIFHRDSHVNMRAVEQFVLEPSKFLDRDDNSTPAHIHEREKPRNYLDNVFLDLSEKELVEAMAVGDYDKIQAFPGLVVEYEVSQSAGDKYRVCVHDKHDPKAAFAGDDINCCMPFGMGKNNVCMFNPNCGLMTVEKEKTSGEWTTIAQSILTLGRDVGQNIGELDLKEASSDRLTEIVRNLDLTKARNYLTCDNVEIRANYQTKEYQTLIAKLYQDFCKRYVTTFNRNNLTGQKINTDKIIIGQGYSDYHFGTMIPNTFLPLVPASYSDNLDIGARIIYLNDNNSNAHPLDANSHTIDEPTLTLRVASEVATTHEQFQYNEDLPHRISPLTYQDSLLVAQVEDRVHNDSDLIARMTARESSLIAKDINNAIKNRPNLSFKYGNQGYLMAYEGMIPSFAHNEVGDTVQSDRERGIYIEDLVAEPRSAEVGGALITAFLGEYQKHYLEKGNNLPIFASLREGTSYPLVINHLEDFSRQLGIDIAMTELDADNVGEERIHEVIFRPSSNAN